MSLFARSPINKIYIHLPRGFISALPLMFGICVPKLSSAQLDDTGKTNERR